MGVYGCGEWQMAGGCEKVKETSGCIAYES